ncbi:MAG TPA: response regulator [Roseomonas sp.]|jgi:CheY-like chemotaxis protein
MPDTLPASRLKGRRILVVEDEYMIADDLRRALEEESGEVIGPVPKVADALKLLAAEEAPDGAVLDVNLGGEMVFALADLLRERGVPFVFLTGYDHGVLPHAYRDVPHFEKPASVISLIRALYGRS